MRNDSLARLSTRNEGEKSPDLPAPLRRTPSRDRSVHLSATPLQLHSFYWPERFLVRQTSSDSWENTPWMQAGLRDICSPIEDEEEFTSCLKTEQNWAADEIRLEAIENLVEGATLEKLLRRDDSIPETKTAILIDGNIINVQPKLRPFHGGLSVPDLMNELMKARYKEVHEQESSPGEANYVPDAERRLIYIVNLGSWAVVALLGSAPESLFHVLGTLMDNYIRSTTSLSVSFSTEGPAIFTMEFSFPLRVWRTDSSLRVDGRVKTADGQSLRSSRDVTFLRHLSDCHHEDGSRDAIYASHISCAVTGIDQYRWTGILFAEDWFETPGDDPTPDTIERYDNDLMDGMACDPLARGRVEALRSDWYPRSYFLSILDIRLLQAHDEWLALLFRLETKIKEASKKDKYLLRRFQFSARDFQTDPRHHSLLQDLDDFEDAVVDTEELLRDCEQALEETLKSLKSFMATDAHYFFANTPEPTGADACFAHLTQIRKTCNALHRFHRKSKALQTECKSILKAGKAMSKKHLRRSQMEKLQTNTFQGPHVPRFESLTPNRFHYLWAVAMIAGLLSIIKDSRALHWSLLLVVMLISMVIFLYASMLLQTSVSRMGSSQHGLIGPRTQSQASNYTHVEHATLGDTVTSFLNLAWRGPSVDVLSGSAAELSPGVSSEFNAPRRQDPTTHHVKSHILRWIPSVRFLSMTENSISIQPLDLQNLGQIIEYIPICLPVDGKRLPELNDMNSQDCHDDRSFFSSLRELLQRDRWFTWSGFLSRSGLREPIGMHYVEYELYHDGYVSIRVRQKVPPISEAARYRPTESPSFEPVPSKRLMDLFKSTADIDGSDRSNLDRIIHRIDGLPPQQRTVGIGYGLEIEESPNSKLLWLIRWTSVVFCVVLGVVWAARTGDIESGFAISTCLIAFSMASVAFLKFSASRSYSGNEETGQNV